MITGRRIEVRGSVQGVGFRPWVWRIAHELGVGGRVRNDSAGVTIDAFGEADVLDDLVARMHGEHPPAARIVDLRWSEIPAEAMAPFTIVHSVAVGAHRASIPPDLATCDACLGEVLDPSDRRYRYPFTNCTDCGPRFTIAWDVPYDRPATSMAGFRMCPACQAEYDDPANRRFHAQPNACPACGPRLSWLDADGHPIDVDALGAAVAILVDGGIIAIKGLGGFHLACDATNPDAVASLRSRKRREEKPFAVMVADLDAARALARLDPAAEAALTGPERPIVLAPWRDHGWLAASVAPEAPRVALFLPYTPLHHLLLAGVGRPLVMTSGNLSGEPIVHTAALAVAHLHGLVDGFLVHDREITTRTDDSVLTMARGGPLLLRRSRGWVPRGIPVPVPFSEPVLAVGGDLKNACCVGLGDEAFLGPHVGDVQTEAGFEALGDAVERMERFLGVKCRVVARDLHPGYLSTRWAEERDGIAVAVQHHHAHVAGALAAEGLVRGLGVAYDGTGYGPDGAAWGGEILRVDGATFERVATWRPIALPGGELAIRQPWRTALAWCIDAFADVPNLPLFHHLPANALRLAAQQHGAGVNSPLAHGIGRRFDAIAAMALGRPKADFEGQLAMAWEGACGGSDAEPYPYRVDTGRTPWEIDDRAMLRAAVHDLQHGTPVATVSARFHATVIAATADVLARARAIEPLPAVLCGGCFANVRLVDGLLARVDDLRLPRDVPPGDGGLALGQAVVALSAVSRQPSAVSSGPVVGRVQEGAERSKGQIQQRNQADSCSLTADSSNGV